MGSDNSEMQDGTPVRKTHAEAAGHDFHAGTEDAVVQAVLQGDEDGGGDGVAGALQVDVETVFGDAADFAQGA